MAFVGHFRQSLQLEKKLFEENREAIRGSNRRTLTVVFGLAILCFGVLSLVSFVYESFFNLRTVYLGILALLSFLFLLFRRHTRTQDPTAPFFILCGCIVLCAAFSSAFVTPDYVGVIILACLFEVPVLVLARRIRILLFEGFAVVAYLGIVVPRKEPSLVPDEIVNAVLFALIGTVTGIFIQRIRLENIDLLRRREHDRVTDPITGLANRRRLFEVFIEYEEGCAQPLPLALAMIDIDSFKDYNDTYGHLAGDQCLARIGACFAAFGTEHALEFFRYGGEEFVALARTEPEQGLLPLFEALNQAVGALRIPHALHDTASEGGYVTVSIGVARIGQEQEGLRFEEAIDRADRAMYLAKCAGKNQTRLSPKALPTLPGVGLPS